MAGKPKKSKPSKASPEAASAPGPGGPSRVAPAEIDRLKAFLSEHNFRLIEEIHEPNFFGDRWLRWSRSDIRIQVALDRGRWFVDVPPAWAPEWSGFGLEIVLDAIDDVDHFTHLLPLPEAIAVLEDRIDEIAEFLSTDEGCAAVGDKRRERAHKWFGA
jgi:hypothetical protein